MTLDFSASTCCKGCQIALNAGWQANIMHSHDFTSLPDLQVSAACTEHITFSKEAECRANDSKDQMTGLYALRSLTLTKGLCRSLPARALSRVLLPEPGGPNMRVKRP